MVKRITGCKRILCAHGHTVGGIAILKPRPRPVRVLRLNQFVGPNTDRATRNGACAKRCTVEVRGLLASGTAVTGG